MRRPPHARFVKPGLDAGDIEITERGSRLLTDGPRILIKRGAVPAIIFLVGLC
jgi:hypothetical protein